MMKCGHAANALQGGKPVCVICAGINEGCNVIVEPPDLTGRMACCAYRSPGKYGCNKGEAKDGKHGIIPSSPNLAFFEHKPAEKYDEYYCGCFGWD
jgi:hypothetical protein